MQATTGPTGSRASAASAEEALHFARTLAGACARALGDTVAGVVLHGSLTLDDYVPGRSDVDVLVVVDDPLTDVQFAALTRAAARQQAGAPGWVDLRVVTRQVAARPTPAPPMEAYLELVPGSGMQVERRHPGERDLVVEFSICRAHGRGLVGAMPAELIGQVPTSWVLAVGDAQLADWQAIGDDPKHAELTVLTACRVWRFAEEGRHCSKTAAGRWALRRDPTLQVVADALGRRHGDPTARIDPAQVQRLLAVVRARLADAGGSAEGGEDRRAPGDGLQTVGVPARRSPGSRLSARRLRAGRRALTSLGMSNSAPQSPPYERRSRATPKPKEGNNMRGSDCRLETLVGGGGFFESPRWHAARLWVSDYWRHQVVAISPKQVRR
jgi:hypothetical protein